MLAIISQWPEHASRINPWSYLYPPVRKVQVTGSGELQSIPEKCDPIEKYLFLNPCYINMLLDDVKETQNQETVASF